jgi:transmembrane sensor
MNPESAGLESLFEKYFNKTASPEERAELASLVNEAGNKEAVMHLFTNAWEKYQGDGNIVSAEKTGEILDHILGKSKLPVHKVVTGNFKWWRQIAAAVIILAALGAGWFVLSDKNKNNIAQLSQERRFKNDISPARQQVILTLSDGSTKILDSVSNGTVTLQGTTQAVKNEGSIAYLKNNNAEPVFNTITTEKGRTFHLQLADGTDVWLDALSSIHFPTAFPGSERVVEITGQAYFEVATLRLRSGKKQPFKVRSGNQVIEVLGTHFNINTYNQQDLQTTLLEGSVKVTLRQAQADKTQMLQPGQQARVNNNGIIKVTADVDVDEVMAWKNGRFQFNGNTVEDIMSQLSRWYDIDVVYQDKLNKSFVAKISKEMPVSKLLGLLEMTKEIKFVIEGNKVTVMKW